jgi:nucleotidyltransferase-like protein
MRPAAASFTVEELASAQSEALRNLMPPLDAVGIGGSHGRGAADSNSDVDFFLLLPRDDFWPQVAAFPSLITHPVPVMSEGVGRFRSDYGYRYAYLLEGGHKVEYHLNSPETLSTLPLSARIRIVADRSGYMTSYLDAARTAFERDVSPHVAAGVHDCLIDLHDLRKYAARGDLLPMVWKMDSLRRNVLALEHIRSGDVYAPSSAATRLDEKLAQGQVARVAETVPALDCAGVLRAYEALRAMMLESWEHFAGFGVPTGAQFELQELLSDGVLRSLRGIIATAASE